MRNRLLSRKLLPGFRNTSMRDDFSFLVWWFSFFRHDDLVFSLFLEWWFFFFVMILYFSFFWHDDFFLLFRRDDFFFGVMILIFLLLAWWLWWQEYDETRKSRLPVSTNISNSNSNPMGTLLYWSSCYFYCKYQCDHYDYHDLSLSSLIICDH